MRHDPRDVASVQALAPERLLDLLGEADDRVLEDRDPVHLDVEMVEVALRVRPGDPCPAARALDGGELLCVAGDPHAVEPVPPGAFVRIAAPAPSPKRNAVSWSSGFVIRDRSSAVTTITFRADPPRMRERPTSSAYSQPEQAALRSKAAALGIPRSAASAAAIDGPAGPV